MPDLKFHRGIGEYKEKHFSLTGELLDRETYTRHLQEALPTEKDREELLRITKEPNWIAAPN